MQETSNSDAKARLTRMTLAAAALAAGAMAAGMAAPPFTGWPLTNTSVLTIHLLMELFAIVIAILVVVLSWHTFDAVEARFANILICGFLIVAACDICHALTYQGMPPLLAPSSTQRAIFFWLMGRSFEVITMTLLAVEWSPPFSRRFWLGSGLLVSAALIWFGSYHVDAFPDTFVEGHGVTPFKTGYEYALCAADILVAMLFWKRARGAAVPRNYLLALSSFVMGVGEIMFSAYVTPSDFQNIYGHAFKLAAYALLYRATFVASMRKPIEDARASERRVSESERKLRGLYELSPLGIALTDMQGRYIEFNEAFRNICGYPADELKALDYWKLTPKKYEAEEAAQLASLERTGRYGPYEKEYVRKDGSLIPLRLNGMLITLNDGKQYIWSIIEDIADRKAAVQAMERERVRLETILRTSTDGIHVVSGEGLLIEANDVFLRMLGYDRSAIGQLRVTQWNAHESWEAIRQRLNFLMSAKETVVFETVHKRRDGKLIDVEISACGIEIEGQRFIYASSRDITGRKEAEAARARLAAIVENSNDAIISRSLDGTILSWNAAAERLLGYSAAEAVGKSIGMIMPPDQKSDPELHSRLLMAGERIPVADVVRQRKDGRLIHVLRGISPVRNAAGEIVGAATAMSDIAERTRAELQRRLAAGKIDAGAAPGQPASDAADQDVTAQKLVDYALLASEEQVRQTLDGILEGCMIIGFDWTYLYVNEAAARHGRQTRENLVGRTILARYPGVEQTAVFAGYRRCMEGRLPQRFESEFAFEDGTTSWFEFSVQPVAEGIFVLSLDITERKRAEAALGEINRELEQRVRERTTELLRANQELEAFSYSVSHDLRAPLRALDGFARMVDERDATRLSPESRRMLERIRANANKMGNLINDILQFARISRHEMRFGDVDMSALARAVADELRADYPQAAITIGELPHVRGDASMLRQVWVNLIENALKFSSKAEKPQIRVGMERAEGGTTFSVRDNGAGFDMAYASKLFQVFHRLHTEKDFPGTGAGLAIVKRIVERHGGSIRAESQPGKGAAFYFSIG